MGSATGGFPDSVTIPGHDSDLNGTEIVHCVARVMTTEIFDGRRMIATRQWRQTMTRMTPWIALLWAGLVLAGIAVPSRASAQSGNDLFQQALAKERAEGKLREAVLLYETIVKGFPADRELVARSLVQMGRVHERMGGNDARRAYERVVRDYSDQPAAAEAKRRIAVLDGSSMRAKKADSGAPFSERVWVSKQVAFSSTVGVSHDGRYVSFVDYSGWGDIAVRDLISGETRVLTSEAKKSESASPVHTVFSPDDKYIAYGWRQTLRLVSVRDKTVRTVLAPDTAKLGDLQVFDFTPDGRHLIVGGFDTKVGNQIMRVSIADGSIQPLFPVPHRPRRVKVSRDGKYIVYDLAQDSTQSKRDIVVRRIDGSGESRIVEHPANDRTPLWTPDGRGVFFVSDRGGSEAGWYVDVSNGRATGTPVMVRADIGTTPLGFARDGSVFYLAGTRKSDVFVGEMDITTGKWTREPQMLRTLAPGHNGSPSWSRDSRFLAYAAQNDKALRVHELVTGREREFPLPFNVGRSSWSMDGKWISVASIPSPRKSAVYRVNAETGAYEKIVNAPVFGWGTTAVFAPDRDAIYYVTGDTVASRGEVWEVQNRLVRHDLAARTEEVVYTTEPGTMIPDIAVTPDGKTIIAGVSAPKGQLVLSIPTSGSTPKQLLGRTDIRRRFSFTPDSKRVVHIGNPGPGDDPVQVWSTPLDGSPPVKLATPMTEPLTMAWEFVLAPDGKHVALRVDDRSVELWHGSHFLPHRAEVTEVRVPPVRRR